MDDYICLRITDGLCRLYKKINGLFDIRSVENFIGMLKNNEVSCENLEVIDNKLVQNDKTILNVKRCNEYNLKQDMVGRVFDFYISNTGIVNMKQYNDSVNRKYAKVPDFVTIIDSGAFSGTQFVQHISFNNNVKIVTGAFGGIDSKKIYIDADTSTIVDLQKLFKYSRAEEITLSDRVDTSSVIDTADMFEECRNLRQINFGNKFTLANAKRVSHMFGGCEQLKDLNSDHNLKCTKAELHAGIFDECRKLSRESKLILGNERLI